MHIWIIKTFCLLILGVWIFMTGRFMNWMLLVYCQTSYGLWLSSPICMVSYFYFGVLEMNCIMVHNINLLKYLLLLFFGKYIYVCPALYVLLWKLGFLYFLQGSAPKFLNWSHPCIHWQPNWLAIPVGSSKLWYQSSYSKYISIFSHTYLFLFMLLFITSFFFFFFWLGALALTHYQESFQRNLGSLLIYYHCKLFSSVTLLHV